MARTQDETEAARWRAELEGLSSRSAKERRREELVRWASEDGRLSREDADEVYDLAREESLEPMYALSLARSRYLVRELVEPSPAEETTDPSAPAWIEPGDPAPEQVRERRMRASLRRLRSLLERCGDAGQAADAYLAEPDVARERDEPAE